MLRERTLAWGFICMVTAATPAAVAPGRIAMNIKIMVIVPRLIGRTPLSAIETM